MFNPQPVAPLDAGVRLSADFAQRLPELAIPWRALSWPQPQLCALNDALARHLGWSVSWLHSDAGIAFLTGQSLPDGAQPVAQIYGGHQFGHWAGRLGDGRALLLGEVALPGATLRVDIALKGSGLTPLARGGDGRAALGPMLRELIIGEALHALGIPSTRALAVLTTGDAVWRERWQPGALLVRVAASHVRVGTFQWAASAGTPDLLRRLAAWTIERHDPELWQSADGVLTPTLVRAWAERVIARQARLVAQWMAVGFIHGVMNTDNMALSGESIDFGPCAFMEAYDPYTVFSSIDHAGRYAWGNQARTACWNLARWLEVLMPLLHETPAQAQACAQQLLDRAQQSIEAAVNDALRAKLGLPPAASVRDAHARQAQAQLLRDWLQLLQQQRADWTLAHRWLGGALRDMPAALAAWSGAVIGTADPAALHAWCTRWQAALDAAGINPNACAQALQRTNPAVIARNRHVELALQAAEAGDLTPLQTLLRLLRNPWRDPEPADVAWTQPAPLEWTQCYHTFCGT